MFYRDVAAENAVMEQYGKRLSVITVGGHKVNSSQRHYLLNELKKLYNRGVIGNDALDIRKTPKIRMLTSSNSAVSTSTRDFLTPRDAYIKLDSTLSGRELHDIVTAARLSEIMVPNIITDSVQTARFRNEAYQTALAPIGVVQQGERIIDRGDIVTPQLHTILSTYEQLSADRGASVISDRLYSKASCCTYPLCLVRCMYISTFSAAIISGRSAPCCFWLS